MSDIDKLPDGRFRARWDDPPLNGRRQQRTKIFTTKREAEDHLAEVRTGMRKGSYLGTRAGNITLRAFATQRWLPYIEAGSWRPNTAGTYRQHLRKHVLRKLGDRKIGTITKADCRAFAAYLGSVLAPATVPTAYAVLRSLMNLAVDDQLIALNPTSGVKLPEPDHRVLELLQPAAIEALAAAITPKYEVMIWLGAGLGLREGEALGLQVSRVDFLRRRVHVLEQMQGGQLAPLKTKESRRVIPADDFILAKITAHLQRWPTGGLIVTNRSGRPVTRGVFGTAWRAAVEAAGLPKGTRYHELRHFYASVLIAANLNVKVVQSRLGHTTASQTLEVYSHLWPDDGDLGRGAVAARFAADSSLTQRGTMES